MPILTDEQRQHFIRDGYVVIRDFYTADEMAAITAAVTEVQNWPDAPGKYQRYYEDSRAEPGARLLNRLEHFSPWHDGLARVLNGRLADASSELFGEPVNLFKEKINFKLPGGDGFAPHQDHQAGWGEYASLFISAMVCIDAATVANGCLEIAPGQHRRGMFEAWKPISGDDCDGMRFQCCPTEPGDVVFFDSFAPHRSKPNDTTTARRLMFITYNRASEGDHLTRYYADKRKNYPQDCERDPDRHYAYRV